MITGIGSWTPFGVGWDTTASALLEGRHAFTPVGEGFGPDPGMLAGRIRDFQPFRSAFPEVKPPLPIAVTRLVLVAAQLALADAGLGDRPPAGYGVMLNRSRGPARVVADIINPVFVGGPRKTSPLLFSQSVANAPLGAVATTFGLRGPHLLTLGGGVLSIAFDAIRRGEADGLVVGGFEEHAPEVFAADLANGVMPAIHDEAELATRGPVLSEGAVCVVLEDEHAALARGAQPVARVRAVECGSGRAEQAGDPLRLWGCPDPLAFTRTCARALARAGVAAPDLHIGGSAGIAAFARAEQHMREQLDLTDPSRHGSITAQLGQGLGMGALANLAWSASRVRARKLSSSLCTHFEAHANYCATVLTCVD